MFLFHVFSLLILRFQEIPCVICKFECSQHSSKEALCKGGGARFHDQACRVWIETSRKSPWTCRMHRSAHFLGTGFTFCSGRAHLLIFLLKFVTRFKALNAWCIKNGLCRKINPALPLDTIFSPLKNFLSFQFFKIGLLLKCMHLSPFVMFKHFFTCFSKYCYVHDLSHLSWAWCVVHGWCHHFAVIWFTALDFKMVPVISVCLHNFLLNLLTFRKILHCWKFSINCYVHPGQENNSDQEKNTVSFCFFLSWSSGAPACSPLRLRSRATHSRSRGPFRFTQWIFSNLNFIFLVFTPGSSMSSGTSLLVLQFQKIMEESKSPKKNCCRKYARRPSGEGPNRTGNGCGGVSLFTLCPICFRETWNQTSLALYDFLLLIISADWRHFEAHYLPGKVTYFVTNPCWESSKVFPSSLRAAQRNRPALVKYMHLICFQSVSACGPVWNSRPAIDYPRRSERRLAEAASSSPQLPAGAWRNRQDNICSFFVFFFCIYFKMEYIDRRARKLFSPQPWRLSFCFILYLEV